MATATDDLVCKDGKRSMEILCNPMAACDTRTKILKRRKTALSVKRTSLLFSFTC